MDFEKLVEEFSFFCDVKLRNCKESVERYLGECVELEKTVDCKDEKSVSRYRDYLLECMDSMHRCVETKTSQVEGAMDLMRGLYWRGPLPDTEYKRMKEKNAAVVDELEDLRGEASQKAIALGLGTYKELEEPEPTDQEAALEMVNAFFE